MKSAPIIALSILLVAQLLVASPDTAIWARICRKHHHHHKINQVPLSWCKHILQGRRHQLPPPLPPAPPEQNEEIDPRYGVSKRLVPTGPNPLHN
ncbi:Protein FON2 SPARE1 [Carex littledalei]|uniref:Protein FON2 SPARE1 n=1 Tax=Carex littledalei TaxID=544730 RepID=A0A833QRK1_9POAL|nr:Protein FON2 SPARE1 [Carex littledalei]